MEENFEMSNISAAMTEEAIFQKERKEKMRKKLRFSANYIGFSCVLFVSLWELFMRIAVLTAKKAEELFLAGSIDFSGIALYNKYILIINEATLALALVLTALVMFLIVRPKVTFEPKPIQFSRFVKILLICFGAGYIGNLIGTVGLSFWNIFTGNSVGNELQEILSGMNPIIMFVSVVILAPILEELFFRKILIDRLRPFGKIVSIFLPALLFALFHQSATQFLYTFAMGAVLAYLYYETGKYWLVVVIHAMFNWISGFIPILFLPKIEGFFNELTFVEESLSNVETLDEIASLMLPLLENYGFALASYMVYALIVFVINITGLVLLCLSLKHVRKMKEDSLLGFGETVKAVMLNPGMIVCTIVLGLLTGYSLFK